MKDTDFLKLLKNIGMGEYKYSNPSRVFIWSLTHDSIVPVANSILLAKTNPSIHYETLPNENVTICYQIDKNLGVKVDHIGAELWGFLRAIQDIS